MHPGCEGVRQRPQRDRGLAEDMAHLYPTLGVEEALERVLAAFDLLPPERVSVLEALGLVLAEELIACGYSIARRQMALWPPGRQSSPALCYGGWASIQC